uniref:Uncharacterized protein n=1 Tax=Arundo donax TaxID=35708 RepID=A0A0A9HDF3_ARUDO
MGVLLLPIIRGMELKTKANIIMDVLMIRRSGTWHQCIVSHTTTCL